MAPLTNWARHFFVLLAPDVVAMGVSPDGRNINAGAAHCIWKDCNGASSKREPGSAWPSMATRDRALFVCETGKVVNGDGVLLAAARFLKAQNKLKGNRVVATSMSNLGLERVLARESIALARANVGDRYVLEEMLRSGNVLGGEQSGHIIFLDDSPAGDGLLTAVKIASLVSMHGKIESLVEGLKDYPQLIVNVKGALETAVGDAAGSLPRPRRSPIRARRKRPHRAPLLRHRATRPRHGRSRTRRDVRRFSQSLANALRSSIGA